MPVRVVSGDLFASGASALVSPVNCVGVSGAGLAKVFARRFPAEERVFVSEARAGRVRPGTILVVESIHTAPPNFLVYLPTKRHWRDKSRLPDVERSLVCLRGWALSTPGVDSIALPALGCGYGGLDFDRVRKVVARVLRSIGDVDVSLYEPRVQLRKAV